MYLRKFEQKDAVYMLEWMHDKEVTKDLAADFEKKQLKDAEEFIISNRQELKNLHLAIVSDTDEYMGTVSLKNIDKYAQNAEFAIIVRKRAMGKGYARYAMMEILRIAFEELELNCVYWCVSKKNKRALKFYEKHGFHEALDIADRIKKRYEEITDLKWYSVLSGDDYQNKMLERKMIAGCKIISIKTIPTVDAGELSYFEAIQDIPFNIKRVYYISKVPEGVRRGYHAHKKLKQLLFCPYGKIQLILDDGNRKEEIILSDPSIGILIEQPIWREMLWLEKDSVLCVTASDFYDESDYIRDYQEFLKFRYCIKK
ncbi:MAG: GNAT family N-acetyltransferase [Lachnospiraceae bacterium]|uniref:GNAT family N-acetyltransferase n=1 Tax=Candidatus Merdisoma sp. JLR.KK011 TaxID=3114299 RepID=UPI002FF01935|nr:GNAT family N-acetyltransferase [Lachnospiraceae bacterium]